MRVSNLLLNNKIFTFFVLFFLVGCQKQPKVSVARQQRVVLYEREARLTDVPLVLDAQPIKKKITDTVYSYQTQLDVQSLSQFYIREMERFGWRLLAQNRASEIVLIFQKPVKICVISLCRSGSRTRVLINSMPVRVYRD